MTDQASILSVAETERDQAATLLTEHYRTCPAPASGRNCTDCELLEAHAVRTARQVELLAGDDPDMEALW